MDYKELQAFTREIIFRCHLATPSTYEEAELYNEGITLEHINKTAEVLVNLEETDNNESATESIINAVCDKFKMDETTLRMKTRKRPIVEARQIAMHLLYKNTKYTLAQIGWMMGRFDHATVLHSVKTVVNLASTDKHYAARLRTIKNSISCQ